MLACKKSKVFLAVEHVNSGSHRLFTDTRPSDYVLFSFFLSDNNLSSEQKQEEKDKECPASIAKSFVVEEMYEAKLVSDLDLLQYFLILYT